MDIVVVMCYCDGFGNDGYVIGIFDSVKTARTRLQGNANEEYRYIKAQLNTSQDFDWYEAIPLYAPTKKKKSKK